MSQAMEVADVLRVRRLELLDADDVVRLVAHCDEYDGVFLELFTPKRDASLVLSADEDVVEAAAMARGNTVMTAVVSRHSATSSVEVRHGGDGLRLAWPPDDEVFGTEGEGG